MLDKAEQELKRQYLTRGKYSVTIITTITPLERNRVAINFKIEEGEVAKIKQINIVGTQAFKENLNTNNGFSAFGTSLLVELDGSKQVTQVGNGQRRLAIGHRRGYYFIDSVGSVDNGKFGVQAQVYKHAKIVGLKPKTAPRSRRI